MSDVEERLSRQGQTVSEEGGARRAVLSAIRKNLAASAPFDAARHAPRPHEVERIGDAGRAEPSEADPAALAEVFREALEAVGGRCAVVGDAREAAETVRRIIEERGARRVAVSDSPLAREVTAAARGGAELLDCPDASALFDCDVGVTGARWGVAETGTLVIDSDRERNRLTSLIPPVHVAVIEAARILPTMAAALQLLGERGAEGMGRSVTFITGPSRTSDIELTLAIGVHGPAEMHVVLIGGRSQPQG